MLAEEDVVDEALNSVSKIDESVDQDSLVDSVERGVSEAIFKFPITAKVPGRPFLVFAHKIATYGRDQVKGPVVDVNLNLLGCFDSLRFAERLSLVTGNRNVRQYHRPQQSGTPPDDVEEDSSHKCYPQTGEGREFKAFREVLHGKLVYTNSVPCIGDHDDANEEDASSESLLLQIGSWPLVIFSAILRTTV